MSYICNICDKNHKSHNSLLNHKKKILRHAFCICKLPHLFTRAVDKNTHVITTILAMVI